LADDLHGLIHFESHLANFREHLEVEVSKLTSSAQALTETKGWWDRPHQARQFGKPRTQRADSAAIAYHALTLQGNSMLPTAAVANIN
jgi:hypothetical protein